MNTTSFLQKILPPPGNGYYCVAAFVSGLTNPPRHKFFLSVEEAAGFCKTMDDRGCNVFHACATYQDSSRRKQDNTQAMQSFWLDLDVKPGHYPSQAEAAKSILEFCRDIGVPMPMLVSSGRGLHCYWPLTEAISPILWRRTADMFAAVLGAKGVKVDPSRTTDHASILRPVGSHHRKGDPIPVKLRLDCEPMSMEAFSAPLMLAFGALGILPPKVYGDAAAPKSALSSGMDKMYAPSSGAACADKCPVMGHVRDTQGDAELLVWRGVIGVLKHCTDGWDLAEAWTARRAETKHEKDDWQYQWHSWTTGPTTCAQMAKWTTDCASCPWQGKVTSPIMLGQADVAPSAPVAVVEVTPEGAPEEKAVEVDMPAGFRWSGTAMERAVRYEDEDTKQWMTRWEEFCAMLLQVGSRVRDIDGTYALEVDFYNHVGEAPRRALLPTSTLVDKGAMTKVMASYEAVPTGKSGARHMTDFLIAEMERRRAKRQAVTVRAHMGWQNVDDQVRGEMTGEFVFGSDVFRPHTPPQQVNLSQTIPAKLRENTMVKGDIDSWVRQVNHIYNRPDAEPWQFAFAVAFGAPLVRMIGGIWHGIPYVMYGASGVAKTTTALVATTIYGPAPAFHSSQVARSGDTLNATISKIGAACNLPMVLDELSERSVEDLQTLIYAIANGMPKDRCMVDGTVIDNRAYWDTLILATTNTDLRKRIREIPDPKVQDAIKYRLVQVELDLARFKKVFAGINPQEEVESALLNSQYGVVGRKYIQHLVDNMEKITGEFRKTWGQFAVGDDASSERYYRYLVCTAIEGAKIAKKLGLIHFDIAALERWARHTIIEQRKDIHDWNSNAGQFLASLQTRTLVTRTTNDPKRDMTLAAPAGSMLPVARYKTNTNEFWVAMEYMEKWCADEHLDVDKMLKEMHAAGFVVLQPPLVPGGEQKFLTQKPIMDCMGVLAPRVPAIQIRPAAVEFDASAGSNVLQFRHPDDLDPQQLPKEGI